MTCSLSYMTRNWSYMTCNLHCITTNRSVAGSQWNRYLSSKTYFHAALSVPVVITLSSCLIAAVIG